MSAKEKKKAKPQAAKAVKRTRKRPAAAKTQKIEKKRAAVTAAPVQQPAVAAAGTKYKKNLRESPFFLIVRIRGSFGVPHPIEYTLRSLRLKTKFNATLMEKTPIVLGMLRHVKDYVTWGEVNADDIANLFRERGELITGSKLTDKYVKDTLAQQSIDSLADALAKGDMQLGTVWGKGVNPVFRLHPPSGGFAGTIKRPFGSRGELGYRHGAISTLAEKMT